MKLEEYDIVVVGKEIYQYLGYVFDSGIALQDIHAKETITHKALVDRKATKDEKKWFCENTEHVNFIFPKGDVR